MAKGFLIAAPQSGSGKTVVTLAILRALKKRGTAIVPAKAGPDYIDPAFHAFASGETCVNLDSWAMRIKYLKSLLFLKDKQSRVVVEGMMGLFDGAADGSGSSADLAALLGLPVVLVVDCTRQSHSIAAQVSGFCNFRENTKIAGVMLNKVGSERHETMLRDALGAISMPVMGALRRDDRLTLPSRHLGLVHAGEHAGLDHFLDRAADLVEASVDIDALLELRARECEPSASVDTVAPLGQHIAIAKDEAFAFIYPHLLRFWHESGAEISFFSPLQDEAPSKDCTAVYLPGGYPELHAAKLSANTRFLKGLRHLADGGTFIYGECGGYMVLGDGLVDSEGDRHKMAGLLRLETSFAKRKLQLGYRVIDLQTDMPFAPKAATFSAHEFHYSTVMREEGEPLFEAKDALNQPLGLKGLCSDTVAGSYMHLIDKR